ncbi:MAG: hypothetical protein QXF56_05895 [Candidatus Micrarchaeia archaeon]
MNLGIWVNGNEKFGEELKRRLEPFEKEMKVLEKEISKFHKKRIGSREYWYKVGGRSGVWEYVCPADTNPIRDVEEKLQKLKGKINKVEVQLNSAVVKVLGKHLVIDLDKLTPSDGDVISFIELYRVLREMKK